MTPIAGVSGGLVSDDRTDRPYLPGDPPSGGESPPASVSNAMVMAPI